MSILFQYYFPTLYFITIFPLFKSNYAMGVLRNWNGSRHAAMGLTHNIGFTIGYVIVGMYAFIFKKREKTTIWVIIGWVFFGLVLFMSTKRAHFIFVLLSVVYVYLNTASVGHKLNRYVTISMIIIVVVLLFIINKDQISDSSTIGRLINTFSGFNEGNDITNGRTIMYADAIKAWLSSPLVGIGWKRFASVGSWLTTVHNVFLQLLCEVGVIGAMFFVIPIFYTLFCSIDCIKKYRMIRNEAYYHLCYATAYQLFFVLYGLTGNPLYDYTYSVPYLISIAISISSAEALRTEQ